MSTKKGSLWPLAALALVFLAFAAMYSAFIAGGYILVPLNRLAPAALSTVITAAMVVLTVVGIRRNRAAAGGGAANGAAAGGAAATSSGVAAAGAAADKPAPAVFRVAACLPLCAIVFVIGKAVGYDTDGIELYLLPAYAVVALACSMAAFFSLVPAGRLRTWLGVAYVALMVPMLLWLVLWDFGPQPMAQAQASPHNAYRAQAVLSDRGLFGQNTLVYVRPQGRDIELAIGTLEKRPQQVYKGAYGEALTLRWESDDRLAVTAGADTLVFQMP